MNIYLYVKTHNKTGLKYLGKTKQNPYKYPGSGKRWSRHLKIHGDDVKTEIIQECNNNEEVKRWGIYYSKLWDVVNNNNWANLKEEEGDGGYCPNNYLATTYNTQPRSANHNASISKSLIGKKNRSISVIIDNIIYESMRTAAKSLNVCEHTIYYWIKIGKATKLK